MAIDQTDRQKQIAMQKARQDALHGAAKDPSRVPEVARITFPGFNPNLQQRPKVQDDFVAPRKARIGPNIPSATNSDENFFDKVEEIDPDTGRFLGNQASLGKALDKKPDSWKDKFKKMTEFRAMQDGLRSQTQRNDETQSQVEKVGDAVNIIQQAKGDPRKIVGGLADKYLKAGMLLGTATWVVWVLLTLITSLLFVIGGLPALIILNIMLVSPKTVYRISELILDLVGVGEALQIADQAGLGKVDIRINQLQKGVILIIDAIWLVCLLVAIAIFISVACAYTGNVSGFTAKAADWWYGTTAFTELNDFCKSVNDSGIGAVVNSITNSTLTGNSSQQ